MSGTAAARVVVLAYEQTPLLVNRVYRTPFYRRAEHDKEWREHFGALAEYEQVQPMGQAMIEVRHLKGPGRGKLPDVGSCYPSVKAAVDGLVDAGVLPDDTPAYLTALVFHAPERGDADRVELSVHELAPVVL